MFFVTSIQFETVLWAIATVIFIIAGSFAVGFAASRIARWQGVSGANQRKIFWGFLFASPWIIGFVIFVVGPALASLYYSFTEYSLGTDPEWIGFENYRDLLQGSGASGRRFHQAMYNSMYYALIGVPLQILASLAMALLLNTAVRGIRTFRLIFYMPVILAGGPAILLAWRYMLASNGGFINESMRGAADSFFLFDWLYRSFIYSVETFNGFYAGLTRGDPIGPLKYAIPAFIGIMALFWLSRGYWEPAKRNFAQRVAELVTLIISAVILAGAFANDTFPPALTVLFGLVAVALVVMHVRAERYGQARLWQWGGLILLGLTAAGTLYHASTMPPEENFASSYLLATAAAALPLIVSVFGKWNGVKYRMVGAAVLVVCAGLFIYAVPGQLDGGRLNVIPQYVTLQSAIAQPDNMDYLDDVFPHQTMSTLWVYGLVVVAMLAVYFFGDRSKRTRNTLIYGGMAFFGLFFIGAVVDTVRYFQAYETIALANDTRNFHFALFRSAAETFPDSNRIPLWLSSELWSKPALILIQMWSSGAGMLIFLAALKGVPDSLYEAAEVDGANRLQRFFKITLPMISPAMFYNVVIGIIAALQTFEIVYILQNTQNQDSLASAAYFLYQRTFQQLAIGEGSAMSWILALIIVVLTAIQFRYSNWVHYEA